MLVGEIDAADHVVALPDHPHLLWHLDEIERLDRIEQLPGDATGPASRLRAERKSPPAAEHLFIRGEHLRRGPGLEDRILGVAQCRRHLTGAVEVAVEGMGGILLDGAMAGTRRRIEPAAVADPCQTVCRKLGNLLRGSRQACGGDTGKNRGAYRGGSR